MSKIFLYIDTAVDTHAGVLALVASVFGVAVSAAVTHAAPAATLHPLDNPAVGATTEEAGDDTTATNADGSIRFDAQGLPWDARIHATPPSMTKKNIWRAKRAIDDATVTAVSAELRAKYGSNNAPALAPAAPAAAPAPLPVTVAQPGVHPGNLPIQAAASLPGLPGLPGIVAPAPVVTAYQEFAAFISANTAPAGKLPADYMKQGLASYGVQDGNIQNMATMDEDKVKAIHAAFVQAVASA